MDKCQIGKYAANDLHDSFAQSLQIIAKSCYAKSPEDIEAIMDMLVHFLGIPITAILVVEHSDHAAPVIVDTLRFDIHNEWLDYYINRNLARYDPVVERVLELRHPLVWNNSLVDTLSSDKHRQFPQLTRRFGVSGGLVYPFPLLPGVKQDFILYALADGEKISELSNNIYLISSLLHYPCEAIRRLYNERHKPAVEHPLTARERQVLEWASQGKTSQEIALILSISERTVKFHLTNTYEKLGVINRQQAITKAIHNQLL